MNTDDFIEFDDAGFEYGLATHSSASSQQEIEVPPAKKAKIRSEPSGPPKPINFNYIKMLNEQVPPKPKTKDLLKLPKQITVSRVPAAATHNRSNIPVPTKSQETEAAKASPKKPNESYAPKAVDKPKSSKIPTSQSVVKFETLPVLNPASKVTPKPQDEYKPMPSITFDEPPRSGEPTNADIFEHLIKMMNSLEIVDNKLDSFGRSFERQSRVFDDMRKNIFKMRDDALPISSGIIIFPVADDVALENLEKLSLTPEGEKMLWKRFANEGATVDEMVKRSLLNLFTNTSKYTWTGRSSHNAKNKSSPLKASTLNVIKILEDVAVIRFKLSRSAAEQAIKDKLDNLNDKNSTRLKRKDEKKDDGEGVFD